jgi:hypothetical protein
VRDADDAYRQLREEEGGKRVDARANVPAFGDLPDRACTQSGGCKVPLGTDLNRFKRVAAPCLEHKWLTGTSAWVFRMHR